MAAKRKGSSTRSTLSRRFPWRWDVFLSFRGEDTRFNFTDHLYNELMRRGIRTFRDDEGLERGGEIQPSLLKAIEDSMNSVVVFSQNYAHSKWCLDELDKIMRSRKEKRQMVLPVFYHVDPSDVRKQKGSFEEAFARYGEVTEERVLRWRKALTEAANLAGWHVQDGYETEAIQKIVQEICHVISVRKPLDLDDKLIGMGPCLKDIASLISNDSADVRMIGIHGIGGIGKTTLAKIVYNQNFNKFEGACFLSSVSKRDLLQLQNELLRVLMGRYFRSARNIYEGINMIKDGLRFRRVLVILDDIDDQAQLEFLAVRSEWFGSGSRIIVTTRDKRLLQVFRLYEVKELNFEEALHLFSLYAFMKDGPRKGFIKLSRCIVDYCKGLPLALKVLGSLLYGRTKPEWENELAKMRKLPSEKIHSVLLTSFHGLDPTQRSILLDIACFLTRAQLVSQLICVQLVHWGGSSCKRHSSGQMVHFLALEIQLIVNSLTGDVQRLLQLDFTLILSLMQLAMVHASHEHLPFKRLARGKLVHFHGWKSLALPSVGLAKKPQSFAFLHLEPSPATLAPRNWSKLREASGAISQFRRHPRGLRNYFARPSCLHRAAKLASTLKFPAPFSRHGSCIVRRRNTLLYKSVAKFSQQKVDSAALQSDWLVMAATSSFQLQIAHRLKHWIVDFLSFEMHKTTLERAQVSWKLKVINLSNSQHLVECPNLSGAPHVERLILDGCTSLLEVHPSVAKLINLTILNMKNCNMLHHFPSITVLEKLKVLNLSGCSKLDKFPEIQGYMEYLSELNLEGTAIVELPSSVVFLPQLVSLDMKNCKNLKILPSNICSLKSLETLVFSGCSGLEMFPEIMEVMESLQNLLLDGTSIQELPPSIVHLKGLQLLSLRKCKNLRSLPNSICSLRSLETLIVSGCSNLNKLPEDLGSLQYLMILQADGTSITQPPFSLVHLRNLKELSFRGCKGSTSNSWISSFVFRLLRRENSYGTGLQLPHLSGLYSLKYLNLSGCNLTDGSIKDNLGRLRFLEELDLSRNNLGTSPQYLSSSSCLHPVSFKLSNCFALAQDNVATILEKLHQNFLPEIEYSIVLPGSTIPEWFQHPSIGSSVTIELPPNWHNKDFLGFALCSVFSLEEDEIIQGPGQICCNFEFREGPYLSSSISWTHSGDRVVETDHIWLVYQPSAKLMISKISSLNKFRKLQLILVSLGHPM
ncbi:TMV resistance protein N [Vitis vinifera]|uniref:ADP-ribosyl cyclase/cyclic ADP-ribose hydrolase n=1 Tax=Vitis vinifera TaxID=29760 RepID=A0A438G7V6_VITVI|nr:TMV resistance protein N [Vitis vinifera]